MFTRWNYSNTETFLSLKNILNFMSMCVEGGRGSVNLLNDTVTLSGDKKNE